MKPWWTTGLLIYAHARTHTHTHTHTHTLLWTSSMSQEPESLSLSNQQSALFKLKIFQKTGNEWVFFPPLLIWFFCHSVCLMAVCTLLCKAEKTSMSWNSPPIMKGKGNKSQLHSRPLFSNVQQKKRWWKRKNGEGGHSEWRDGEFM